MTPKFTFYILLLFITVLFGLLNFKKLNETLKLILLLVFIVLSSELTGRLVNHYLKTTLPIYHLLLPVQMVFYTLIYSSILRLKASQRITLKIVCFLTIAFSVTNTLFIQPLFSFPSYSLFLLSILTVIFSLFHFITMLQKPEPVSPIKDPFFWFSAGNLVFFCITFFLFGFFNPLLKLAGGVPKWVYHIIFATNVLLYSSYFLSLWFGRKSFHAK